MAQSDSVCVCDACEVVQIEQHHNQKWRKINDRSQVLEQEQQQEPQRKIEIWKKIFINSFNDDYVQIYYIRR